MLNVSRRQALIDAAIEVLAGQGARGLTFRAVDAQAGVPPGTASNYFPNRDDLLTQAGGRIYQRLTPDAATMAGSRTGPRDRQRVEELVTAVTERIQAYRTGWLALLELRLEATRRPALRQVLTATVRADLEATIAYHLDTDLPGDTTTAVLLYLAVNWLVVESLTLPEVLDGLGGLSAEAITTAVVHRILATTPEG
ncbi:TetR/AcrR family transcriptional regulator [Modestobacter sp. VKM Ac-2978]|uniref:TetR/AcrR family transcriptional regulator n=1 Tax=Modestobacter sp. VKM Ac-2978 TaxID=3004132 RepID=UPI0022AA6FAD|nr:TetR family transcriptional regulator [Modestobacter sp. VKM Ac-2978]MCZ2850496.1 TetR family transcriptional regulator [Modestobacter sp. VKM Ac-2978]